MSERGGPFLEDDIPFRASRGADGTVMTAGLTMPSGAAPDRWHVLAAAAIGLAVLGALAAAYVARPAASATGATPSPDTPAPAAQGETDADSNIDATTTTPATVVTTGGVEDDTDPPGGDGDKGAPGAVPAETSLPPSPTTAVLPSTSSVPSTTTTTTTTTASTATTSTTTRPAPDRPLQLVNPGSQNTAVGRPARFRFQVEGGTGEGLRFEATGLPRGLALDAATGAVTGTPRRPGTSSVQASVTDSSGATHSQGFTWVVERAFTG